MKDDDLITPGCLCSSCVLKKAVAFDSMVSRTSIDDDRFILTIADPQHTASFITYTVSVSEGIMSSTQSSTAEAAISDHLRAVAREVGS